MDRREERGRELMGNQYGEVSFHDSTPTVAANAGESPPQDVTLPLSSNVGQNSNNLVTPPLEGLSNA